MGREETEAVRVIMRMNVEEEEDLLVGGTIECYEGCSSVCSR